MSVKMPKLLNRSNSSSSCYKCTVRLLEDTKDLECEFQANHKGRYLLDYVCEQLNLAERDYFGLRFVDAEKQRHWLDPVKSITKQIKDIEPILFSFRVKFYPPNPFQLKEQITRYQMYLQLKRDLLHGRLHCGDEDATWLGAYILQAEIGDYQPEEHHGNYANELKIFVKQSLNIEQNMMDLHRTEMKGRSLEETEADFLRKASSLDSYGVDPHPVKDQKGNQTYVGVNFNGILIFQSNKKINHYRWNEVQKINYEGKMFIIHLIYIEDSRTKKKETVGFKCPSTAACRHLWRCAIEQMLFFTSPSSSNVPKVVSGGGFFTGSKFKYTGRVEREVLEEMAQLSREEPKIQRVGSLRRKASSVPATPSTPMVNDIVNFQDGNYTGSPRLNFNSLENRLNFVGGGDATNVQYNADGTKILEPVVEDSEVPPTKKRGNFKDQFSDRNMDYSGENHVGGNVSNRLNRSQTPNVHFASNVDDRYRGNRRKNAGYRYENDVSACAKMYSCVKACFPSIILTLTSLLIIMVIAFETDSELFAFVRRAPEMMMIRREYYEPVKEHIQYALSEIYKKIQYN